jgi:hypothetical protein
MNARSFRKPDAFDLALYGLILAAIAGVIYYLQLKTMQSQLDLAERQMRQDQRPWVTITSRHGPIEEDGGLQDVLTLNDTGKTPAKDINIDADIEIVPHAASPRLAYDRLHTIIPLNMLYPTVSTPVHVDRRRLSPITNADEPWLISKPEKLSLLSGNSYSATYLFITYKDIYGVNHWQKWCVRRYYFTGIGHEEERALILDYSGAEACNKYNDVDNNGQ